MQEFSLLHSSFTLYEDAASLSPPLTLSSAEIADLRFSCWVKTQSPTSKGLSLTTHHCARRWLLVPPSFISYQGLKLHFEQSSISRKKYASNKTPSKLQHLRAFSFYKQHFLPLKTELLVQVVFKHKQLFHGNAVGENYSGIKKKRQRQSHGCGARIYIAPIPREI